MFCSIRLCFVLSCFVFQHPHQRQTIVFSHWFCHFRHLPFMSSCDLECWRQRKSAISHRAIFVVSFLWRKARGQQTGGVLGAQSPHRSKYHMQSRKTFNTQHNLHKQNHKSCIILQHRINSCNN